MRQNALYYTTPSSIVRGMPSRRANRMRIAWFLLGAVSGVALSFAAQRFLGSSEAEKSIFSDASLKQFEQSLGSVIIPNNSGENAVDAYIAALQGAPVEDSSHDMEVKRGDTLISMLTEKGVSREEAHTVVQALRKIYNPKSLNIGTSMELKLEAANAGGDSKVQSLTIPVSNISTVELTRGTDGEFNVNKIEESVSTKLTRGGGTINSSLYQTGMDAGIPAPLLGRIIDAYSYDVDFQRDIQQGDSLDVVYEKQVTEDGDLAGHGNVLYAELRLSGRSMKLYPFTDSRGYSGFYNEKGESVKKALLKTPINGARITSGFGMRHHPIMGYSKMHKGVDFGAPTGTPIYAAGDGVIKYASRKGAYGNYLKIQHNDKYASAYGHISRFAPGIKPGKKVNQGQVVAYVGSTGRSTGPHLHYEILVNNVQVNPNSIKFPFGNSLKGTELASFKKSMQKINVQLASMPKDGEQVAQVEPAAVSN